MRRRASALIAAAALAAGGAGLVMAQDQPTPSAPPVDAAAQAPTPSAAASEPSSTNTTADSSSLAASAPPDEAPPPPPVAVQEAQAPAEAPPAPVAPPAPLPRPRFTTAVLQATDKVTAETLRFEARVGEAVRYKGLVITPRACEATAADEAQADSFGYLEVTSQPSPVPGRPTPAPHEVFHGWMSANSPSLNPLPSAGYDVWVIACRTAAPPAPSGHA